MNQRGIDGGNDMLMFARLVQIKNQIVDECRIGFALGKIIVPESDRIFDIVDQRCRGTRFLFRIPFNRNGACPLGTAPRC